MQKHDLYDSLSKRSISTRVIFVFSTADQKVVRQQRRIPTHSLTWSFKQSLVTADEAEDGFSAIVSTVPTSTKSDDDVFTFFREQNLVEHVNRQFKGPIAVRPVFLHSPHRVEALVFLLMIALMIYFLVQRKYRENTPEDAPQKEHRITAATILKAFHNYALVIKRKALGRFICPSQLTARQRDILRRLDFPSPAQTFSRRLPAPPN